MRKICVEYEMGKFVLIDMVVVALDAVIDTNNLSVIEQYLKILEHLSIFLGGYFFIIFILNHNIKRASHESTVSWNTANQHYKLDRQVINEWLEY